MAMLERAFSAMYINAGFTTHIQEKAKARIDSGAGAEKETGAEAEVEEKKEAKLDMLNVATGGTGAALV